MQDKSTLVPGGQRYYVDNSTGAFGFTVPHSAAVPQGAIFDFIALSNGTFAVYPGARGWMACPDSANGGSQEVNNSTVGPWQIFAQLPGLDFKNECVPLNLITMPWNAPNGSSMAAWEYT